MHYNMFFLVALIATLVNTTPSQAQVVEKPSTEVEVFDRWLSNNPFASDIACVIVGFDLGKSQVVPSVARTALRCAALIKGEQRANPRQSYRIEGHFDKHRYRLCMQLSGQDDTLCQQELAEERSAQIEATLVETGVPSSTLINGEAIDYTFRGVVVYRIVDEKGLSEEEVRNIAREEAGKLIPATPTPPSTPDGTCRNGGADDDGDGFADHLDEDCYEGDTYRPDWHERTRRPSNPEPANQVAKAPWTPNGFQAGLGFGYVGVPHLEVRAVTPSGIFAFGGFGLESEDVFIECVGETCDHSDNAMMRSYTFGGGYQLPFEGVDLSFALGGQYRHCDIAHDLNPFGEFGVEVPIVDRVSLFGGVRGRYDVRAKDFSPGGTAKLLINF